MGLVVKPKILLLFSISEGDGIGKGGQEGVKLELPLIPRNRKSYGDADGSFAVAVYGCEAAVGVGCWEVD